MDFFAELPPEPPQARQTPPPTPEWVRPPADEIPASLPMARRLARVPGAALSLRRVDVYRRGVGIELRLDLRREPGLDPERWERLSDLLHPRGRRPGRRGQLRLGVSLADGTRADADTGSPGLPGAPQEPPATPRLSISGGRGSGGEDHWTSEVGAWLWPLPPAGPVTLHFLCEGVGIPEGSVELDAAPILAATAGVIDVWSD